MDAAETMPERQVSGRPPQTPRHELPLGVVAGEGEWGAVEMGGERGGLKLGRPGRDDGRGVVALRGGAGRGGHGW